MSYVNVRLGRDTYTTRARLVAEAALGKLLPPGAQVHHVDEDKRNDAPGNLVICQDQKYHHLLHVRARVVARGGDPNRQRWCGRCRSLQPIESFCQAQGYCRPCKAAYWQEWKRPA
jgi:hypothetical protein